MSQTSPSAPNAPLLLRDDSGGVTTLTLNRPTARNALSHDLMKRLIDALRSVGEDPSVRVVVIAGAGPAFCAGHDLREIRAHGGEAYFNELFATCSELMLAITHLPKPVIARVHGMATAAGCQLVASCDLAVAAASAKFATPGVNIGLFCSTPMVAVSRKVGRKAMMEMLLLGEPVAAADAERLGLINACVDDDALDHAVAEMAAKIVAKSAATVRIGKEAFYRQADMSLEDAYAYCSAVMTRNMLLEDAAEGIDAFLEKRDPEWRDR
ncbi:MAG: enoyl-CoA hydratase [Pseudomonadota bacterium]